MKASLVYEKLSAAIPKSSTWGGEELYGKNEIFDGDAEINKILYCVTKSYDVEKYCETNGYDLLISHHPMLSNKVPQLAFHTALDCCEGGLNDQWRDALGLTNYKHFDKNLGWFGSVPPITGSELISKITDFAGTPPIGLVTGADVIISSVVICTGLGGLVYEEALATGADCYVTGQLSKGGGGFKSTIEMGHTISERCGINLIRKVLGPSVVVEETPIAIDIFGGEVVYGSAYGFASALKSLTSHD